MSAKIAVNMLNFNSDNLAGVGYFIKRILNQLQKTNISEKFVFFYPKNFDIEKIFDLDSTKINVEYKPVPYINNILVRIIYEQLILPFKLYTFDFYYSPTPAIPLFLKLVNKKTIAIVTIHDLIPFYFPNKYTYIRSIYIKVLTYLAAKFSDKIVAVSYSTKKDIVERFKILHDKIVVIYNFIPDKVIEKESLKLPYFLTVSTIEPGKNIVNSIRAFKIFSQSNEGLNFKFFICGKQGWGNEDIFSVIKELSLENQIIFTGYLNDTLKDKMMKECFALIYVSFYEGFGIPPLEAMYYSKPSVVSDTSSLPEVVGNTGVKCNPNDINEIAEGMLMLARKRSIFVSEISNQIDKFNPEKECLKFIKLFN